MDTSAIQHLLNQTKLEILVENDEETKEIMRRIIKISECCLKELNREDVPDTYKMLICRAAKKSIMEV